MCCCCVLIIFFFFKQKTAYDMRISDWSSDVCSSDLLTGSAYAIVDGVDGRTHHLRFHDMEMTGDAKAGSIVELRSWEDAKGHDRLSLATRSDIPLEAQIKAPGATWLDRQLVARDPVATGNGFGREVRDALDARASHLETQIGRAHV